MSSKVNEALFELINSMTKSEKRYFKLLSSRHAIGGENNYTLLFDKIDEQKVYNEEKIFKKFKGEAFLNRFSITKKRLYDHILAALDSYYMTNSINAQLYKKLHSADILYDKSLYDQCHRILRSAEKVALKNDKHEILMLISSKQKMLLETNGYLKITHDSIDEIYEKDRDNIARLKQFSKLWSVKSKLFTQLSKQGKSRSKKDVDLYRSICDDVFTINVNEIYSIETKYLYYHIKSAYFYSIDDLENSLFNLNKNLALFKSDFNTQIESNKQVSVYTNAIHVADKLGYYKESYRHLFQLKKMIPSTAVNEDLAIKLFSSITSIELNICLRKGEFENAEKVGRTIQEKLIEFDDKIVPIRKAYLCFKMAVASMGVGKFSDAHSWINRILNDNRLDKKEDIIAYTHLLDLLIQIELKSDKLLPYSLKNTLRFFKTRNRMYGFETIFLQFVGEFIKCEDPFEVENLWDDLHVNLTRIATNSYESIALDYFDFTAWAEAKLKRKTFENLIRERYHQTIKAAS
tara:strand:- start:1441 stop:2997 length:1557 start_codon:yes stop_codon:yes gene_type:complete